MIFYGLLQDIMIQARSQNLPKCLCAEDARHNGPEVVRVERAGGRACHVVVPHLSHATHPSSAPQ